MRKALSFLLILALLTSLPMVPAFAAENYATARTPIEGDASAQANIERAARAITQTTLRYGETFSFINTVGPFTTQRGYAPAPNGLGTEVVGGGADQAAAALYLALLNLDNSGIDFNALTTYGTDFAGTYVFDYGCAIAVDSETGTDFSFTNHAADELFIEMWASNGYLYCSVAISNAVVQAAPTWNPDSWNAGWDQRTVSESSISCSADSRVLTNVELAANSIYDTTLGSGDVFSFNGVVGPRDAKYGYVSATNGRGAKVTGGGVAQVASAIWLAIRDMEDISIVEKSTYGTRYNQSYVRSSADAILTDYNAGTDFAFRYTGEDSITIYTYLEGNTLICKISKPD